MGEKTHSAKIHDKGPEEFSIMKNAKFTKNSLAAAFTALLLASNPVFASNTENTQQSESVFEAADNPWVDSSGFTSHNVDQMARQIQNSTHHGLNPANYHFDKIVALNNLLKNGNQSEQDRKKTATNLETLMDKAFYKLADHLGSSLVEGRDIHDYYYRSSPKPNLKSFYERLTNGELTVDEAFSSLAPSNTEYVLLQHQLQNLMYEKSHGGVRTTVPNAGEFSVGDTHDAIRKAKLRLLETQDFNGSSSIDDVFDPVFKDAVITFQTRHHISPTGDLNEKTIAAMNRSVNDDITAIVVSLERWRWLPRDLGFQRVIANIPDFRIRMHNGEQKIADMAVVVGKTKHRTPQFSETIKHVVAAPTWTVPASIANNELVPIERKNPGYLQRNNYELLAWENGRFKAIPFSAVPRSVYNRSPFPYTIRQKAGDNNALGDVKILMPNKYAIYFHDTQAKDLFGDERRAYSHGCVRLHDPDRLASLLLQLDGVSQERTQSFLASTKTNQYDLDEHVDSHIVYITTFTDENGRLQFRNDVYNYDKRTVKALSKNSLISIINRKNSETILSDIDNLNI